MAASITDNIPQQRTPREAAPTKIKRTNGTGDISATVSLSAPQANNCFSIDQIWVGASAALTSGNLTITAGRTVGSVTYTIPLVAAQDMTGLSGYQFQPTRPIVIPSGETVTVAWTAPSADAAKTWVCDIIYTVLS